MTTSYTITWCFGKYSSSISRNFSQCAHQLWVNTITKSSLFFIFDLAIFLINAGLIINSLSSIPSFNDSHLDLISSFILSVKSLISSNAVMALSITFFSFVRSSALKFLSSKIFIIFFSPYIIFNDEPIHSSNSSKSIAIELSNNSAFI